LGADNLVKRGGMTVGVAIQRDTQLNRDAELPRPTG
jgi:hypothetical protein